VQNYKKKPKLPKKNEEKVNIIFVPVFLKGAHCTTFLLHNSKK